MRAKHDSAINIQPWLQHTAEYILSVQQTTGAIPWFKGGHIDPWNHVEAAMGLTVAGAYEKAKSAYYWLQKQQLDDGSWFISYENNTVKDNSRKESNFIAYIATGIWHYYLSSKDKDFLINTWPMVEQAIEFALSMQSTEGDIAWAIDSKTGLCDDALVTGCSSIFKSLKCALYIAEALQYKKPQWIIARKKLQHALLHLPQRFDRHWESKARYSMDWFYPILTGLIQGNDAQKRINARWTTFIEPGFISEGMGCRCVSDQPWVTVAESAELTMALLAAGYTDKATQIFNSLHELQDEDGGYWTGFARHEQVIWPTEKTTWTNGAVLLAADALYQLTDASGLFTRHIID